MELKGEDRFGDQPSRESFQTKLGDVAGSAATTEADSKAAAAIRTKEYADFETSEQELLNVVDTLEKAIVIIEKETKGTSFNDTQLSWRMRAPRFDVSARIVPCVMLGAALAQKQPEGMGQSGVAGEQFVTRSSHQVTAEIEAPMVRSVVLGADRMAPSRPKAVIASLATEITSAESELTAACVVKNVETVDHSNSEAELFVAADALQRAITMFQKKMAKIPASLQKHIDCLLLRPRLFRATSLALSICSPTPGRTAGGSPCWNFGMRSLLLWWLRSTPISRRGSSGRG